MSWLIKKLFTVAVFTVLGCCFIGAARNTGDCKFTQTCGNQSVTASLGKACKTGMVCTGDGGCNPIWAKAWCFRPKPGGSGSGPGGGN